MTRARALKHTIRARAAKTGERYTTARRHVLKALAEDPGPSLSSRPAAATTPATATAAANLTKGAISDDRIREKTGRGLDHWFAELDRFGGVEKGHTALARHLHEAHGVPGWHSQGITVAYERARGARTLNQRMSGDYEVSVTKTVGGGTREVVRAFTDAKHRAKWLPSADPDLGAALSAALKAKSSNGFVIRADGMGRFRYKWGATTVQFYLYPKEGGRTSVVVTQMKVADAAAVEGRRSEWRAALAAFARLFLED